MNQNSQEPINGLSFFRDPIWQSIGVVIGIVAIIIQIHLGRQDKLLSYEATSVPLISSQEKVSEKLKILFDERPIQSGHLVTYELKNSGNVPLILMIVKPQSSFLLMRVYKYSALVYQQILKA